MHRPARNLPIWLLFSSLALLTSCDDPEQEPAGPQPTLLTLTLPTGFPMPVIPADNPMSVEKVELGRRLFYDRRLSGNETQSCGDCHMQELAFTDGLAQAVGSTQQQHPRSAMALMNAGYYPAYGWGNPLLETLEDQAPVPMFGENPVELGLSGLDETVIERLAADADYPALFEVSFPDDPSPIHIDNVVKAIAAFERTMISGRSPFDRFRYDGDPEAMSASARRGLQLFFDERFECFHCHGGFNFTDSVSFEGAAFDSAPYHNNGLYNVGDAGDYPLPNQGLYDLTGLERDKGRFKAPSLRNIELTAPYMHDGSIATLEEVIDHYARGGRLITDGPNAGDGRDNPNKNQEFIRGFEITPQEKTDLVNFLKALTDLEFVNSEALSPP